MIDILGTGLTLSSYDWKRKSFKWGLSQYRGAYHGNINLYFGLHEDQSIGSDDEIGLESFPLKEIQEWSGSNYFTSSIAYMIAYALFTGEKEINIFGVDMEDREEYANQRACIAYWIGYGRAIGATVKTATGLSEPPYLYGYDSNRLEKTIEILQTRELSCKEKALHSDGKEKQQWIGAMVAYQKIANQIRS